MWESFHNGPNWHSVGFEYWWVTWVERFEEGEAGLYNLEKNFSDKLQFCFFFR